MAPCKPGPAREHRNLPPPHACPKPPYVEKGDILKVKQCVFPPAPPPRPLSPCGLQKRAEKVKRGVVFCPKPVIVPPVEQPCLAICIEKIKNMPVPIRLHDPPRKCPVAREETGTARCDMIKDKSAAHPDLPWPGCPPVPPPPPPHILTPCEAQKKHEAYLKCKEKQYK